MIYRQRLSNMTQIVLLNAKILLQVVEQVFEVVVVGLIRSDVFGYVADVEWTASELV